MSDADKGGARIAGSWWPASCWHAEHILRGGLWAGRRGPAATGPLPRSDACRWRRHVPAGAPPITNPAQGPRPPVSQTPRSAGALFVLVSSCKS